MLDIQSLAKKLDSREIRLLNYLQKYPIRVNEGIWILSDPPKNLLEYATNNVATRTFKTLVTLEEKGLIETKNDEVYLSSLGQQVAEYLQPKTKKPSKSEELKQAKLARSNEMLELYKQGLRYQDIGNQYNLTRERVRQLLDCNPAFHEYLIEREESETQAQKDLEEKKRQKQLEKHEEHLAKNIASVYPERIAELWDYEKNETLKPEDVYIGST